MDKVEKLAQIIKESNNIVFFGGAGVSCESGIPDFRSANGLYNEKSIIPAEVILSHSFFMKDSNYFYNFYKSKMVYKDSLPNDCHKALAILERMGKLKGVITQNIDGLHQLAGSKNVLELHGTIHKNHCMKCNTFYSLDYILDSNETPRCSICGGIIKPDVVLYEEQLDYNVLEKSINLISNCDTLIIGGTSLTVYPASGLVRYFRGKNLILINKSATQYDNICNLLINDNIGKVFKEVMNKLGENI